MSPYFDVQGRLPDHNDGDPREGQTDDGGDDHLVRLKGVLEWGYLWERLELYL